MTISKPRLCAKCGMDARIVYLGLNYGYVECIQCARRSPDGQIDESIAEWNRRMSE